MRFFWKVVTANLAAQYSPFQDSSFSLRDLNFQDYIESEIEKFQCKVASKIGEDHRCVLVFPPFLPRGRFLIHNWISSANTTVQTVSVGKDSERRTVVFYPAVDDQKRPEKWDKQWSYSGAWECATDRIVKQQIHFNVDKTKCLIGSMEDDSNSPRKGQRRPDRLLYVPRHRKKEPAALHTPKRNSEQQNKTLADDQNKGGNEFIDDTNKTKGKSEAFVKCCATVEAINLERDQEDIRTEAFDCSDDECFGKLPKKSTQQQFIGLEQIATNIDSKYQKSKPNYEDLETVNNSIDNQIKESFSGVREELSIAPFKDDVTIEGLMINSTSEPSCEKDVQSNKATLLNPLETTSDEHRNSQEADELLFPGSQMAENDSCKRNTKVDFESSNACVSGTNESEQQIKIENCRIGDEVNNDATLLPELSADNDNILTSTTKPKQASFETKQPVDEYSLDPKSKINSTTPTQDDNTIAQNDVKTLNDNLAVDSKDNCVEQSDNLAENEKRTSSLVDGISSEECRNATDKNLKNSGDNELDIKQFGYSPDEAKAVEPEKNIKEKKKTQEQKTKSRKSRKMKIHTKVKNNDKLMRKNIKEENKSDGKKKFSEQKVKLRAVDANDDNWDDKWNDSGECLSEETMTELKKLTAIESPIILHAERPKEIDYLEPRSTNFDYNNGEFDRLVEIYDFSEELKTADITLALKASGLKDFDIKWVDDTHAIAVFGTKFAAHEAIKTSSLTLKTRPLSEGTKQSKLKARSFQEMLLPYKERPKTTASVARNLVTSALGLRSTIPKEQRSAERQKIANARESKRLHEKMKKEAWGD